MREKECTQLVPDIVAEVWINFHPKWGTRIGKPIRVLPKRFLGMNGWYEWVDKRIIDGVTYLGEVWLCEKENGEQIKATFRVPYNEEKDDYKYIVRNKPKPKLVDDNPNFHTDGIAAYETKDFKNVDRTQLKAHNSRFRDRMLILRDWFNQLNNINDPELRLGIQLYLRRLETPNLQTSREWKEFKLNNHHGDVIISQLQQQDLM